MSAGFHYDVNPAFEQEEICDVRTLHHKAGAYKLDTTGLASVCHDSLLCRLTLPSAHALW